MSSIERYHPLHRLIHWLSAALILFLFGSGLYMTTLGYYDNGYHLWPARHKAIGILLGAITLLRLLSIIIQKKPSPLQTHKRWEIILAHATHGLLYLLILTMLITGYLLATAKGNSINFFDLFTLPALIDSDAYARTLGKIHLYSAWALILLAVLHALGALKHALIDRDKTLKRML